MARALSSRHRLLCKNDFLVETGGHGQWPLIWERAGHLNKIEVTALFPLEISCIKYYVVSNIEALFFFSSKNNNTKEVDHLDFYGLPVMCVQLVLPSAAWESKVALHFCQVYIHSLK